MSSLQTADVPRSLIRSTQHVTPCYQDLVTFTIGHDSYDPLKKVLFQAEDDSSDHTGYTLPEARRAVRKCIETLHRLGVRPGDTVCLVVFNSVLFPIVYLAIVGLGAKVTAVNPTYTSAELAHHFKGSKTTCVFTVDSVYETARRAARMAEIDEDKIFHKEVLEHLNDVPERDWIRFDDCDMAQNTIACLNSTSGTTGLPKMAARSHYSLVMENLAIEGTSTAPYQVRRLLSTPLFHGFTTPLAIISPLRFGHPTYIMQGFDQQRFLDLVERHAVTETAMPPPMLTRFLAMGEQDRIALESIRRVWCGGAPLTVQLQERAANMFSYDVSICQVWGMTEGGWMTTFHHGEDDLSGSVGRLLGTYEALCVVRKDKEWATDSSDSLLECDDPAAKNSQCLDEIWIRGPINMISYHDNPVATANIMTEDGWLKTGDVGYATPDGRIFIVDRLKELIKVRAWQVAPAEIESRLLENPDIADAAVIGMPDPGEASEIPYLFVVLKNPLATTDVTKGNIKEHLLLGLAKYKVRDCRISFIETIPKNASGKTLRNELRAKAKALSDDDQARHDTAF